MRKLTLYRDDSTVQVVYEDVKHFFFTAANTMLTIAQITNHETGEHRYIHWPRERFCWFKDEKAAHPAPAHGGEPRYLDHICEHNVDRGHGDCPVCDAVAAPSAEAREPLSATEFYMKEFKEVPHKFQDWMHFADVYGEYLVAQREGK